MLFRSGVIKVVTGGWVGFGIAIGQVAGGSGLHFSAIGARLKPEGRGLGETDIKVLRNVEEGSHGCGRGRRTRSDKRVHNKDSEVAIVRDQASGRTDVDGLPVGLGAERDSEGISRIAIHIPDIVGAVIGFLDGRGRIGGRRSVG